jgi:hypothetical protein
MSLKKGQISRKLDFIPPLADILLSTTWTLPQELMEELQAEGGEGVVEVETEHLCVPGQGCALLRHYSATGESA